MTQQLWVLSDYTGRVPYLVKGETDFELNWEMICLLAFYGGLSWKIFLK